MTNILSLTDNQLELIKSLLEPSIVRDDETGEPDSTQSDPLAATIMTQIDRQRALDRKPSLFLSLYETRLCYGGPEEGGWYYYFTERIATELLTFPALIDQWNELVKYCADAYGQVQTPDETTMLTISKLNELVKHVDQSSVNAWAQPVYELHFTGDPEHVTAIIAIEGIPGILADTHRPYYC